MNGNCKNATSFVKYSMGTKKVYLIAITPMKINDLQGWKSRKNSAFAVEKYRNNLHVHHYFCLSPTVPHISFGRVPKIFTCPPPFLPVPDRRTVSNFHPCHSLLQSLHMCDAIFILDFRDKAWYLQNITNKMGRHWPNVAASLGVEDDKVRKSIFKSLLSE